jgi:serine/threonine protein kinase
MKLVNIAILQSQACSAGPLLELTCFLLSVYRYMAPEVYRHDPYNNKVDVYSFAMICFQLFEGVAPFQTLDPLQAARAAAMENKRPTWDTVPTVVGEKSFQF